MISITSLFRMGRRMFSQQVHRFVERPFTPDNWNKMAVAELQALPPDQSLDRLFHSIHLMQQEITPFNYDFYQWSCHKLIENQQELTKEEILMMLRLGCKYKVRIQLFHQHMENEFFLRIHRDYDYEIQEEDEKIKQEVAAMLKDLQAKSQDYFNILEENKENNEEEVEGEEYEVDCQEEPKIKSPPSLKATKVQESQEQKIIAKASKKLIKKSKKTKEISLSDLVQIVQLLRQSGSKNVQMLQYIHQLLTIKYQSVPIQTRQMLLYAKSLSYICQTLMEEYITNKQKYTARSIKRIYKYQTLYFHEHFKQLQTVKSSMTSKEIEQLVMVYAAFPLKRREIRRTIGSVLSHQIKQRNLDKNVELIKMLMDINKKDQKMRKNYCEMLYIEPQEAKLLGYYVPNEEERKDQQKQQI